jgi:Peptidase family M23
MHRLLLTIATTLIALLLLAPPAWAEWVWPLRGEVITPYRNGDDPYASGQHRGIDIAGDAGAPVVAATRGDVRFAGTAGSSGLTVSIRTPDGRYDTSYLHLSSVAVREGDRIEAGEPVGTVGTTGSRSAVPPHLHFGVRDAGSRHAYHDPLTFLPPPGAAQPPPEPPAARPAPVPVLPAPAPVQAPSARRVPVAAPRRRVPVRAPAQRRVPIRAPVPRRVPSRAPSPRRAPAPAPSERRVPVRTPAGQPVLEAPARRPGHAKAPDGGPLKAEAQATPAHPADARAGSPHVANAPSDGAADGPPADPQSPVASSGGMPRDERWESDAGGRDLGLLLACLGLLGAALLLGLTDDGRKATRKTACRIARALQPILGRR